MELISLLLPLLSGAAGGNIVGGVLKTFNLGSGGNSLAGLVGGGLGSLVIGSLLGASGPAVGIDPDGTAVLQQIVGGVAGGGAMTIAVAILHKVFHRHHV